MVCLYAPGDSVHWNRKYFPYLPGLFRRPNERGGARPGNDLSPRRRAPPYRIVFIMSDTFVRLYVLPDTERFDKHPEIIYLFIYYNITVIHSYRGDVHDEIHRNRRLKRLAFVRGGALLQYSKSGTLRGTHFGNTPAHFSSKYSVRRRRSSVLSSRRKSRRRRGRGKNNASTRIIRCDRVENSSVPVWR